MALSSVFSFVWYVHSNYNIVVGASQWPFGKFRMAIRKIPNGHWDALTLIIGMDVKRKKKLFFSPKNKSDGT